METSDLTRAFKNLNLLAFYRDGDVFKIDIDILKEKTNTYQDFINEIYDKLEIENDIDMDELKSVYEKRIEKIYEQNEISCLKVEYQLIKSYKKLYNDLMLLEIPKDDFDAYLKTKTLSDKIIQYQNIKKKFKYGLQSYVMTYQTIYHDTYDKTTNDNKSTGISQEILNHNNPFADISINNQQYLYPDNDGNFKTLSFNIGYTMSKQSTEDSEAIVLSPDFKILKTDKRDGFETSITMDDSLTSPIQDTKGDVELLYI